jgi:dihydrofolate reductase
MSTISIIAAIGKNYELGRNNDMLWHISADLKRFKKITSGHPVIMGRKTFDSINNKPLPNRRNIIITHSSEYSYPNVEIVHSVDEALKKIGSDEEVFILGGATIYEQLLPVTEIMYLTMVDKEYEADTFFPRFDPNQWQTVESINITDDKQAGVKYSFITLQRIK